MSEVSAGRTTATTCLLWGGFCSILNTRLEGLGELASRPPDHPPTLLRLELLGYTHLSPSLLWGKGTQHQSGAVVTWRWSHDIGSLTQSRPIQVILLCPR